MDIDPEQPAATFSRLFDEAIGHHERGELPQAERLYRRMLDLQNDNVDVLHLLGLVSSQTGRYAEAVDFIERAIAINPDVPDFYNNLAIVHYNHGQYARTAGFCEEALRVYPDHPALLATLGNTLFQLGRHEQAAAAYERVLSMNPDDLMTRFNLANAYRESGRPGDAIREFEKCLHQKPDYAEAHNNLGNVLRMQGEWQAAMDHFNAALESHPDYTEARANLGLVLHQLGRQEEALAECEKAIGLRPDFAEAYNTLGLIYRKLERLEEARVAFEKALQLAPAYAEAYNNLGGILMLLRRLEESQLMIEKALELNPDFAEALCCLGNLHVLYGDFEKAGAAYERALALDPGLAVVRQNIAGLRKSSVGDRGEIAVIQETLRDPKLSDDKRANLHFALGKIYDDCGQYEQAFRHYREGNELVGRAMDYNPEEHERFIGRLIDVYGAGFFRDCRLDGDPSQRPVFIVGMPRSGTTLVEQIIASHPLAHGADELEYFNRIAASLPALLETDSEYPACAARLNQDAVNVLVREYLDLLSGCAPEAVRVTDKMPGNFLHLGLIAILFPNAGIVHCRRNALDTCLSVYFQKFTARHPYAYDLTAIGHYYHQYERLMAHWRNVLPVRLYELDYEKLIADKEQEIRRLIDYLGLPWDRRCLAFHETRRPVMTASSWQVRQPIYTSSIHRWKNYESHLGPLKQALGLPG